MTKLVLTTREQPVFEQTFAAQIADFRKVRPDIEIEVVTRPIADHYHSMVHEGGAGEPGVDLFLCCTDWLPTAYARGLIHSLDPWVSVDPPQDWPIGWHPAMQKLVYQDSALIALPWHDGPQMFIYRTDLFESPAEQERFLAEHGRPLSLPKTWSEFLEVAKFFNRPETGLNGCVLAGYTDHHNNVYDFLIHLWSRGGELLDAEFRPVFDSPVAVEALTWLRDLYHVHQVMDPVCLTLGSVESGNLFAQGDAAMMWNWCGFAAYCELPEHSNVVGKIGTAMLPGGENAGGKPVSLNIYWGLTIAKGCRDTEAAYAFLKHIAQPHCDKMTSMIGANGTRLSTWNDPEVRAKYPYYNIIEEVHGSTLTLPAIPEYGEINDAISAAVHRVIHEGADPQTSLTQGCQEATEVLQRSGRLPKN